MPSNGREIKVGLLVLSALMVFAVGIFLVGEKSHLFARKNRYFIRFATVAGLSSGNPVQLNGVNVGTVERVVLPEDPGQEEIEVWISIERRYAGRVRADSEARIKTLGLLGDKYVEITSGSPGAPQIASGQEIPAAPATSVDRLIASGEDVVDNLVAISHSLRKVLTRMEHGEGLLGELTVDSEASREAKSSLLASLQSMERVTQAMEGGEGPLPRLIHDRELGDRFASSIQRLDAVLAKAETGEGLLPGLLNDPKMRDDMEETFARLKEATDNLAALLRDLREGEGLLARLVADEEYGRQVSHDLQQLLERLNLLSQKLTTGDGTAAQLINDPQVYEALNDILVGVNESKLLRWLIRNRQKAGIRKRYEETRQPLEESGAEELPPSPPGGSPDFPF